ncbi:MAG: phenylalanine--tRNA ligase subunit alpha [Candidatus Pacearchaeota archaeon]
MDSKTVAESLSPIERIVLPSLSVKEFDVSDISKKAGLDKTSVLRALGFLKNKGLVEIRGEEKEVVDLDVLGVNYLKKHLPERVLLDKIFEKKSIPIKDIKGICGLNDNEAKVALGALRKKALVEVRKGEIVLNARPEEVTKKMLEEIFMEKLPLEVSFLEPQDKMALGVLKSRKEIVKVEKRKTISVKLTSFGVEVSKINLSEELIEQLTPKIIKQGLWKGKKFRRYDLTTAVPKVYGGKRHFVNQATGYAKSIWLEMGFKEMTGSLVQTSFWNFDALFTAQDHPVREMQDTFYLKNVEGKLPEADNKNRLVEEVKKSHEKGVGGSKGWQYKWNEGDARKVVLRTHTTCLSAQTLKKIAEIKEFPAKYFALGKCFRNETVDWSHSFEFNQTEGIVVDENANFRQLLGYLVEFFKKMGYEQIRIRPAYFPYTEPSLEIDVFHPTHKKWVELGGAGMFRPEVTIPIFGRHIPVLAWGPGFDRIIMEFFKINDLREMYRNDLTKLRETRVWRF